MKIQFLNVPGEDFSSLDIALTQLATYINKRTKHKASITDFTFHRRDWIRHLKNGILKEKPEVIGISTNRMYMQFIMPVIKEIKEKYGLPVILGGAHASVYPDETISIPFVDAVCIGDGEFALDEYLSRLENGRRLTGINGIWVKESAGIIKNQGGCFRSWKLL